MIQSKKLEKDWLQQYTLSSEQRKKLIEDKIKRAVAEQSKRLSKTIGKFSYSE